MHLSHRDHPNSFSFNLALMCEGWTTKGRCSHTDHQSETIVIVNGNLVDLSTTTSLLIARISNCVEIKFRRSSKVLFQPICCNGTISAKDKCIDCLQNWQANELGTVLLLLLAATLHSITFLIIDIVRPNISNWAHSLVRRAKTTWVSANIRTMDSDWHLHSPHEIRNIISTTYGQSQSTRQPTCKYGVFRYLLSSTKFCDI